MEDLISNSIGEGLKQESENTINEQENIRFAIFGDSKGKDSINEKILRKTMERIGALNPEPKYIVILGDSTDGSKDTTILKTQLNRFENLVRSYHPTKTIIHVLGNHEVAHKPKNDAAEKLFADTFLKFTTDGDLEEYNKTVYYLDIGNTRLIVLNSHHCGETKMIGDKQLEWFRKVASEPIEHKFVFVHAPAYPTGAHSGTCLDKHPEQRNKLWKIIDESNIDIFFAGHEHNYSRRIIDNSFSTEKYNFSNEIYQVVSGGGGEKLRHTFDSKKGVIVPPKAVYHFLILDIQGKNIRLQAISLDGEKIDEFTITK